MVLRGFVDRPVERVGDDGNVYPVPRPVFITAVHSTESMDSVKRLFHPERVRVIDEHYNDISEE